MPETASPDHVLPDAESLASSTADRTLAVDASDAPPVETEGRDAVAEFHANGHVHDDATPAQANGHVLQTAEAMDDHHDNDDERPAKRQRTRNSTPPPPAVRKLKPISPPWKKIEADGPTSYHENGRRKSGRINSQPSPVEPPSTKRTTRHSANGSTGNILKENPLPNGKASKAAGGGASKQKPTTKTTPAHSAPSESNSRYASRRGAAPEPRSSSRLSRRRTPSPPPPSLRHSTRTRRGAAIAPDTPTSVTKHNTFESSGKSPRLKLKVGPRLTVIPLVHPDQVRKRPRIGTDFDDFWDRAGSIPVEEGGLLMSEDGPPYTDEMAQTDARMVLRIEREVEPGGLLSVQRCSLFAPEGEEEPPRQWARQDHMTRAASHFRKLMIIEQQRHRSVAKKLAEACREEWLRRQPKSAEEIEAEARAVWLMRYRVVLRSLFGTWENVRAEVNRRRLAQWEAEEQKRVKAALNQAVSLSEQKLQARRAGGVDSESLYDEDDGFDDLSDSASGDDGEIDDSRLASAETDGSSDGGNDGDDSDVMSSSGDEEDEDQKDAGDEGLTQEQLRAKYANIPELEAPEEPESVAENTETPGNAEGSDAETSDESVDMDDDLGSTDFDGSGESGDEGSSDESGSEDGASGLLGLFFGKSELKAMSKGEAKAESPEQEEAGTQVLTSEMDVTQPDPELEDDDEMSLVRHPDSINGDDAKENGDDNNDIKAAVGIKPDSSEIAQQPGNETKEQDVPPSNHTGMELEHVDQDTTMADVPADSPASDVSKSEELKSTTASDKYAHPETEVANGHSDTSCDTSLPTTVEAKWETKPSNNEISLEEKQTEISLEEKQTEPVESMPTATDEVMTPEPSVHKVEVPPLLRGTLREYQRQGLDWLAGLYANNTNGILADEMGLGKTIQTIALLAHLACRHEVWGPHLVIVPTSVMLNWEMEFKKWCPGFKILAYYGSQEERKRKRQGWNNDDVWNVCITSYQLVLQDQQVFRRRRWHYMILDEAHNIKNFKSQRWQTLLGFNTHSRLLLTGTPLQNNLTELWSLLFFLMPAENGVGGFADLQEFHDWFRKPESQILESGRDQMDDEAKAIIGKLHKVLRPYLLRRLKADVEKQMPAKYEHVEFCRLSKRQRELYDGFLARSDTRNTLASGNYLSIINCLMQLRKVCNHPDLFVDRPIMTSFRMRKSVTADYQAIVRAVQRSFFAESPMSSVNLAFLNLVPTQHEHLSTMKADSIAQLSSHRILMDLREAQKCRAQNAYTTLDPGTVESNIAYVESAARWGRFEELQHCVYLNALRRQQRPIYGSNVVKLLNINAHNPLRKPRPLVPRKIMDWFESDSAFVQALTPSLDQRADSLKTTIEKFSCVTPAVVTRDLDQFILGRKGIEAFTDEDLKLSAPVRWAPFMPKQPPSDPWHEARMRLTIQFPDKRLLQYDCGKLQALDKLLRKLQSGGHRALIFTQMTKVLDILEQFLNIHGHKYLRLDGATKVEQRQILTDRFNHDSRILCFILSTRSGGLGINLTGADTVIFYDQDWNPAMDKQCQDRCHRIGQTRDVHIYRLVSEHTIEANILRKASQKQMLDDVVIQEGEFTTDTFNRPSVRDVLGEKVDFMSEGVAAADAALDLVLGGSESSNDQRRVGRVFEQAEDKEDVAAARVAEKEILADDADFTEKLGGPASGTSTARQGTPAGKSIFDGGIGILDGPEESGIDIIEEYNAWGGRLGNIDDYMLSIMTEELKFTKLELPKDKKKGKKKGKDTRKR
ncbi:helicase SWR1 [Trichoderma asperellum]|uniref:DNA helicase n=1 Tax=Trichoderma asperellum TaxID=101201 RepID=A0A6V8R0U0_TRIAP|nr:SNF2 family N-terminal domain-containing protein [Trichoderma asperelloides]GFP57902.1 helicase SWR1 [Trichoderma asperellum]